MAPRIDNSFVAPARPLGTDSIGPKQDLSALASDVRKFVSRLSPEAQQVAKQMEQSLLKSLGVGAKPPAPSTDSFDASPRRF